MLRFAAFSLAVFLGNAWCADEAAGRGLYLEGVRPSGEPLSALVGFGQTALSGAAVACGNCHGADGKGRAESSVRPPEITWQELTKPYGHAHASGRKHAAFERREGSEWFVRDVGSLNGTYVNGEQVDETKLASGDEVQVGKFKLTFFAAGE